MDVSISDVQVNTIIPLSSIKFGDEILQKPIIQEESESTVLPIDLPDAMVGNPYSLENQNKKTKTDEDQLD
jgi:hypothetical protein